MQVTVFQEDFEQERRDREASRATMEHLDTKFRETNLELTTTKKKVCHLHWLLFLLPVRCWDNAYLKTFCYRTGMLQQNIAVPPDLLTNNCNVHKCTHWARINDWYESIVTSLYVTIDDQSQQ